MKFHVNIISTRSAEDQSDLFVSTDCDTGAVGLLAESVDLKAETCDTVKIPVADPVQLLNRLMGALGCRIVNGEIVEAPKFKIGHRVRHRLSLRQTGTVIGFTTKGQCAIEWDNGEPGYLVSDSLLPDTDDFF